MPVTANNCLIQFRDVMLARHLHPIEPTCAAPILNISISPIRIVLVLHIRSIPFCKTRNPTVNKYIARRFVIINTSRKKRLVERGLHYTPNQFARMPVCLHFVHFANLKQAIPSPVEIMMLLHTVAPRYFL